MAEAKKRNWETPQILSDLPLRETDTAHFHFDEFAATLARLVADPSTRTPLTIGVSGAWGSGKTTLLQRVQTLLDTRDGKGKPFFVNEKETAKDFRVCKTVWFDAWKYNDEDELLVALTRVILNTMGRGNLGEQLWSEILDKTAPRYDVLATFVNMFKVKFGGLEIGLDLNKYKTETEFYKHTSFFDHFNSAFEELLARWVHGKGDFAKINEKKGALVIFIDDLDRCLPEKTVQVLETVKLFLDKPGCVFVIGAHTQVVQEAVTKFYAGMTVETASDYLEKIIQLRFELPPILENQMGDFMTAQGLPEDALKNWETIVAGAEINPRKVKTFLNDLNLAWALLKNTSQTESVNRADFTRWQVLMRAAPETFKKQVHDIDDIELRFQFIQRALAWVKGDDQAIEYFKDYEKFVRLKRTLKKIGSFSRHFTAEVLDAFIHFTSPVKLSEPITEKGNTKIPPKKEGAVEPASEKNERLTTTGKAESDLKSFEIDNILGVTGFAESTRSRLTMRSFGNMEFVPVPKGKFVMGSREDNTISNDDEKPQHTVDITHDYWIARFLVTNEQYAKFIESTSGKPNRSKDWKKKLNHPVVNVSWNDVHSYCNWLNETQKAELPDGLIYRLPTEAEWEKAARGEFGHEWPWGNEFDKNKCNTEEGEKGETTPVGAYSPQGDSPYGCADMIGNVWEWTHSVFKPYPYLDSDGRENITDTSFRVVRGGTFNTNYKLARCAYRFGYLPYGQWINLGIRLAIAPLIEEKI